MNYAIIKLKEAEEASESLIDFMVKNSGSKEKLALMEIELNQIRQAIADLEEKDTQRQIRREVGG